MNYPKRLIEVDLPIKQISAHARREKSIRHGHISTLHIWWARRPLAACRAVLCAALWPDPADENCPPAFRTAAARILSKFAEKVRTDATVAHLCERHFKYWLRFDPAILTGEWQFCPVMRYYLLDFIADFANWDAATNPVFLETARALTKAAHESLGGISETHPLVVDPFAGGGAIPLEALRVGADAFASDLNPVAVLLNKVVLEYIPKYGQRLADEVRKWGNWIKEQAEKELAEFYPKDPNGDTPIAYLWARTIRCEGPGCGAEVPLMRSFWLAKTSSKLEALHMKPNLEKKRVDFEIIKNPRIREVGEGTIRRGSASCPVCGYTTPVASVRRQLRERHGGAKDARLLAVVVTKEGKQGRFYRLPTEKDIEVVQKAAEELKRQEAAHQGLLTLVPDESLPPQGTLGFRVQLYGMGHWRDLFTSRQTLALITLVNLVRNLENKIIGEYDANLIRAVQTCLALAIDKQADSNSSLCAWRSTSQDIGHTFGRQALPILWDFIEGNILSGATRDWLNAVEGGLKALESLDKEIQPGNAICSSATKQTLSKDMANVLATDPPYYDAVPYADLSDFFYVWLKRSIGDKYPDLFSTELTSKDEECVVDEVKGHNKAYFENMMGQAMAEGCRILAPDGICVVVFAHKSTSGWEAQLQAMVDAGWTITGSWPIDTEMGTRLRAIDSAALASSIHLVCRPRKNPDGSMRTNDVGDWRDVLQELPKRIHEWMPRLAAEGIVGADAIFSCLGPALEIFSQYSRVERADGEPVTLKEYLEYVWAAVSREALNTIFQGADTSGFEPDSRLTAIWLWTLVAGAENNGNGNGKAQKPANGPSASAEEETADDLVEEEGEEAESGPKPGLNGYAMEYDTARKLAQGLGVHLEKVGTLVEIKGSTARLRSVRERARFLFQKGADDLAMSKPQKRAKIQQQSLFSLPELAEEASAGAGVEASDLPEFTLGATILDRLHQAMLLYAAGRTDALRHFLKEEGAGTDQRFWKLAIALSSLYPRHSDERRWVDGVQYQKKSLGL
jgi:putative DNA methylase